MADEFVEVIAPSVTEVAAAAVQKKKRVRHRRRHGRDVEKLRDIVARLERFEVMYSKSRQVEINHSLMRMHLKRIDGGGDACAECDGSGVRA